MSDEDYTLHLLCMNCHHEWVESIPKGMQFYDKSFLQTAGYGHNDFDARKNKIDCPHCGCNTVRRENSYEANRRRQGEMLDEYFKSLAEETE